ncbi:MAG: hypothetical protein ACTHMG_07925 [Sphingomonas sp.]
MRRLTITLAVASAVALGACSRGHDNVTANAVAPAGFVPPTALDRTDFIDMVDRRFNQLDVNHDSELSTREIPERHHDIIASFDVNHDGRITKDEFEKGSLGRFDDADLNGDKVLTGEERRAADLGADNGNQSAAANDTAAAHGSANNGN